MCGARRRPASRVATQDRYQACPVDRLHGRDKRTLGDMPRAQQRNTKRHRLERFSLDHTGLCRERVWSGERVD